MASKKYLEDIKGIEAVIDFDTLIKDTGLKALLPPTIDNYVDELDKATDDGIHQYLCNLDNSEKDGQSNKCKNSKNEASNAANIANGNQREGWAYIEYDTGEIFIYGDVPWGGLGLPKQRPIQLPKNRKRVGENIVTKNMHNTLFNQMKKQGKTKPFYVQTITEDRSREKATNRQAHIDSVNGVIGKSIGQRAILFDNTGKVHRGADAIRDNDIGTEMSSKIPSQTIATDRIPDKIQSAGKPQSTKRNHANKGKIAGTNDLTGGIAAIGGLVALAALTAALMPMVFLLDTITFFTTIVTFFTNVNNVVNTYLSLIDGIFSLFGQKGTTKKIKKFVQSILDNAFGKKNVSDAKSAFAESINSISVTTKLLEKVQQGRAGTDNKIDEVAFSLGVVNNTLKDSGVIPADSPYLAQSEAIDKFVDARAAVAGNEDLKENIDTLTDELKTHEETNKTIAEEKKVIADKKAKDDKATADVLSLVNETKVNVDKVRENDL